MQASLLWDHHALHPSGCPVWSSWDEPAVVAWTFFPKNRAVKRRRQWEEEASLEGVTRVLFLPDSPSFSARIQAWCVEMDKDPPSQERIYTWVHGFLGSGGFAPTPGPGGRECTWRGDVGASAHPVSSASAFPPRARAHVNCQVELVQGREGLCAQASALKRGEVAVPTLIMSVTPECN